MAEVDKKKAVDEEYVLKQYEAKIGYYWGASRSNKLAY